MEVENETRRLLAANAQQLDDIKNTIAADAYLPWEMLLIKHCMAASFVSASCLGRDCQGASYELERKERLAANKRRQWRRLLPRFNPFFSPCTDLAQGQYSKINHIW